jgi:predicted amidohydrolase
MQDLNITIIQSNLVWENKAANLSHFEKTINNISDMGDIVVLPEMFNTAFSMKPEIFSEPIESETHNWMQEIAQKYNTILAGSYMVNDDGSFYNRFIVMHPDGKYEKYDKRHLFRMGNEHKHFTAGSNELIFEIKGWKIKALICYDLRFPVFAKNNYSDGEYDYDALIYVANWPKVRNHIWQSLLLARSIENQAYVIGVNRIGKDGNGLEHAGSSCILNSKGEFIIEPRQDIEFTQTATLRYKELEDFRNKFTVGLDWDKFNIR